MDMMQRCMNWMMGLGPIAMLLGLFLLVAVIVLVVLLIVRLWSSSRRG